jgi:tetratricopeptide (TPR) repeat protein
MAVSGRLAEAERFAERSVTILEKSLPPGDPVLLSPLQILAAAQFEQGKTGMAREAFKRMQSIRSVRPQDRALLHGMAGVLLQAEGRHREAESDYLAAMSDWEEAGLGATADAGAVLNSLASLYMREQRLDEARKMLDRAFTIFTNDKGAVPMDRIKLLTVRGVLHAWMGEWQQAEQDLHDALSMADRELRVDPVALAALLTDYAQVLRKNHRRREARSIEARATALHRIGNRTAEAVVDVTELLAKPKPAKK